MNIGTLDYTRRKKCNALQWKCNAVVSFLTDRTQTVFFDGLSSRCSPLNCGVPQGSVLGPLLFVLYTSDVAVIAERWDLSISLYAYADDIQLLGSALASATQPLLDRFASCISDIEIWMSNNFLKLNSDKTQFLWLGTI
jgi:Reverse transcriptase (RNA-dependent DNA polymerase)